MLAERLELHAPQCSGDSDCGCHPILDLAAFVQAVVDAHFTAGAKRRNGTLSGAPWLSRDDEEDLHQYLLVEAWACARMFDGRGRLNGFVLQRLHFRCTDWTRRRFGSTRYHARPEFVSFDDRLHDSATYDDVDRIEDGRHIDRDTLSPRARSQLALLELVVETGRQLKEVAEELGVSPSLHVLRREVFESNGVPMAGRPPSR
jgi:DNA-directed RNA polymerase specialized sigma24 family protein